MVGNQNVLNPELNSNPFEYFNEFMSPDTNTTLEDRLKEDIENFETENTNYSLHLTAL